MVWLRLKRRFRPGQRRPCSVVLLLLLVGLIIWKLLLADLFAKDHYSIILPLKAAQRNNNGSSVKQYAACPIPQLDPFDKRILHLLHKTPPPWNCEAAYPRLFKSALDSTILPERGPDHIREEGYVSCCYKTVERLPIQEDDIRVSSECFPLSIVSPTKIPAAHELIAIFCKKPWWWLGRSVPLDAHSFVPLLKPRKEEVQVREEGRERLNVVVFGVDSMSRMNFQRNLPQSYAFLKDELGAVEMLGFNKVGRGTDQNVIPLLSAKTVPELDDCRAECPYLWKNYSDHGYHTAFNEDAHTSVLPIRLKPGLIAHPPHHYIRPLARWATTFIGSKIAYGDTNVVCYGPRLTFQFLLDQMQKFVYRMSQARKPFFHFTWSDSLTHDYQAAALLGDPHLLRSLKWLKDSGYLNNTILILLGDHGNLFESFRSSTQGQLEGRLPALFLVFPDSFKEKYGRAYRNVISNMDKLTTPFDVHETLLDILDLDSLQENALRRREEQRKRTAGNSSSRLPRGLSLFLPIPEWRTCDMAGIVVNYCSCITMSRTPHNSSFLVTVANTAVSHINSILESHPQCSPLQLKNVTLAQQTGLTGIDDWKGYIINFVTKPGGRGFEAVVDNKGRSKKGWAVQGTIEVTSEYGPTSRCVQDGGIKPYCYCLDQSWLTN